MTRPPIRAAGCVLWRPSATGVEVALVHRPRYDDWSFPKGKLDAGETLPACAVREVAEETGLGARLGARLGQTRYLVPEGPKEVHYWAAAATGDHQFVVNAETDELRFLDVDKASALLTHRHDVDVLTRFAAIGVPTSTVLLVRHAKAGNRHQWEADDDLRPLSGTGREQARKLARLVPLFGPERLATAPPVRCVDTIAPTAEAMALAVADEPLLGEEGYWADPAAGLARLQMLAGEPGVVAICSQGGVIPDVVGTLAGSAELPSKKASTWVLTFSNDKLRAADYYRTPAAD